jgi:hypothetical protein
VKLHRDGDRLLQLLIFNEECLVSASHQLALITSLPFVHTARRSYRLDVLVKRLDWRLAAVTLSVAEKFVKPSHLEEGEVVTRFLPLQSTEASAARKGARRDSDRETMSGLKELVERPRARSATPSNCGDAHPTHEHQAARRPGARGRGNDPGYGKSVVSRSPPSHGGGVEVGHPQPSPEPGVIRSPGQGCSSQTEWWWVARPAQLKVQSGPPSDGTG